MGRTSLMSTRVVSPLHHRDGLSDVVRRVPLNHEDFPLCVGKCHWARSKIETRFG